MLVYFMLPLTFVRGEDYFFSYLAQLRKLDMDTQDQRERRRRVYAQMTAVRDFAMGLIYLGAGLFLFFHKQWGMQIDLISRGWEIGLGVIIVIYGGWRILRGIQKNY